MKKVFEITEMEQRLEMSKWSLSLSSSQDMKTGGVTISEKAEINF